MHPLFVAHLIGDFLVQPTVLVRWKERSVLGIAVHAGTHGLVMALFLMPTQVTTWLIIGAITLAHGIIDQTKVSHQRHSKGFETGFLIDQIAHFVCIAIAVRLGVNAPEFWQSQEGTLVASVLLFLTFGCSIYYLTRLQRYPITSFRGFLGRIALITTPFALFIVGAIS